MHLSTVLPRKRETLRALGLFLAATALSTTAVLAGGQFKSGGGTWGSDLTVFGLATGLGKTVGAELGVSAAASGRAPALCQNYGGNVAPGQINVAATGTGSGGWPITRNGRASGTTGGIVPVPAGTMTWEDGGCPNSNWTVVGLDATRVQWESVDVEGETADGMTFAMTLICTTSFRADGTTFGTCVRQ